MDNKTYDVVLCTYVLNVLGPEDRKNSINRLKCLTKSSGSTYITVRRDVGDHIITGKNTHQFYVSLPFQIIKETADFCIYQLYQL